MKFIVGDRVKILTGRDKEKTGVIKKTDRDHTYPYGIELDILATYDYQSSGAKKGYGAIANGEDLELVKKAKIKFKVGQVIIGVSADIDGCIGRIVEITSQGYIHIQLLKLGNKSWHNSKDFKEWQIGNILRRETSWRGSIELFDEANDY